MKIKTIQFQDYRAFYNGVGEQYLIKTEEKNVLIYGENGSGKTSFFRGLKDFIQSAHSELSSEIDFTPHNQGTTGEGFVKVKFSDDTDDTFNEAGTKATKAEVAEASQINTFLSYKELLRTHLLDLQEGEAVNLFPLLINRRGILWNYEAQSTSIGELMKEFDASNYTNIAVFTDIMARLVENDISNRLYDFLSYFEQDLEVELEFLATQDTSGVYHFGIIPRVYLFDNPLENHQDFLNEARLSALALSIYLSAIASNPTSNTLKCLFLDDVFIGLDMSNRLPLLDILKTEFADYQIFMTTYDRHWFEVAKSNLGGNWKCIEMYVGESVIRNNEKIEVPIVLQDPKDYIGNADKYFKLHDYPAAGNYLRKECERLLKLILSKKPSYLISLEGKAIDTLDSLINQLVKYHKDNNIKLADNLDRSLRTYKDAILNPASHDDLKSNLYKKEIENTFEFVKILSTFELPDRKLFLESGAYLRYYNPTFMYEILLLVSDNIYCDGIRKDALYQVLLKKKSFKVCWWKYKGAYFYDKEKGDDVKIVEIMVIERTLESVKTIIFNHALELEKDSTQIPQDKDFIDSLTIESKNTGGATLRSLIEAL